MLDLDRMLMAHERIDPAFLRTPLVRAAGLDAALGCALLVKDETRNPIGSFKGRGAELFAATALRPGDTVVAASAGNFGQGLARAAARRGHACIVFAATTANPLKIEAMRGFGAEVRLEGEDFDAAKDAARAFAAAHGHRFVEDGGDPTIAEGAGTIGLELAAEASRLDSVLVPLGNGALLAGIGAALRHVTPSVEIIGVVAEQAPAMRDSLLSGRLVTTPRAATIADGIGVRVPVPAALEMLRGRYDDVVTVSEEALLDAMRLLHRHMGRISEPAGVAGVAAILSDPARFRGRRVATILCGANVAPDVRARAFAE